MFLDPKRYWQGLCERVGCKDWLDDPRFADLDQRIIHGDALIAELIFAFKARDLAYWRKAFEGWDAPWEVCQTIREITQDPQAVANDYMFNVKVADGTDVTLVSGPVAFNGSSVPQDPNCAPILGQHTDELLDEIVKDKAAIADLKAKGIVV